MTSLYPDFANPKKGTLLDWINQKDRQEDLEAVAQRCLQSLNQYTVDILDQKRQEKNEILSISDSNDMKEIRGLAERLYGLDELLNDASKICKEQSDHSSTIYKQLKTWMSKRDPSVLPELCKNHRSQLEQMKDNYQKLREKRRRITQAKTELSTNLHQRLRWIMHVEKKLSEKDTLILRKNIERLTIQLEAVKQIHMAPRLYVSAIIEVVRRRKFSSLYTKWTKLISGNSATVFDTETQIRNEFDSRLNDHFLSTLFPGISDFPPPFGLEPLPPFDESLPEISEKDIQMIRDKVPELFDSVPQDFDDHVTILSKYFDLSPSDVPVENADGTVIRYKNRSFVDQTLLNTHLNQVFKKPEEMRLDLQNLREDTIRIKKEGQEHFSSITQTVQSFIQEKQMEFSQVMLEINQKSESDLRQKDCIIENLREEVSKIRKDSDHMKDDFDAREKEYENRLKNLITEHEKLKMTILEREIELEDERKKSSEEKDKMISQLTQDLRRTDEELNQQKDMTQSEQIKNEDLKQMVDSLTRAKEDGLQKLRDEIEKIKREFEERQHELLQSFEDEKSRVLKEQKELLTADHKNEMESLRSRYKLAVSTSTIEHGQDASRSIDTKSEYTVLLEESQKIISDMSEEMELKKLEYDRELQLKDQSIKDLMSRIVSLETTAPETMAISTSTYAASTSTASTSTAPLPEVPSTLSTESQKISIFR